MFNRRKLINNHILQWFESLTSKLPLLICKIDENYSQFNIELYKESKTNQSIMLKIYDKTTKGNLL